MQDSMEGYSELFITPEENNVLSDNDVSSKQQHRTTKPEQFEDAIAILIDAMLANPGDETLQKKALISLKRMAQDEHKRLLIGQSGCIYVAITAMRTFSGNVELLCKGTQFIANVSLSCPENQKRVCDCRGLELFSALMAHHKDSAELQCFICLAMRNLTQESDEIRHKCIEAALFEAIRSSMKRFPTNKDLQVQGIATIGNLASYNLETQKRLRECECIDAVIEAMKRYPSALSVQRNGVYALRHICYKNETNQREVTELDGVNLLTGLLRSHQNNSSLIVDVCCTIRYMCFVEEVRALLGLNGGLVLMIEALHIVEENGKWEDAELVLKAMSNATFSPQENKRVIAQCGGVEAVMTLMKKHKRFPDVIGAGLRVFRNVADKGGTICQLLGDAHVFAFAMACAEQFPSHEEISEHLFALILYSSAVYFEEGRIGRKLEQVQSFIDLQLQSLPESIEVQKIGRELSAHLENLAKEVQGSSTSEKRGLRKFLSKRLLKSSSAHLDNQG